MKRQVATTNLSLLVASADQKLSLFVARTCRFLSLIQRFHLTLTFTRSLPGFPATVLICRVMTETTQRKGGGKPFRSILAPHFEFIRELRQRRKTWQQITELLFTEKGIRVTVYAPYLFYRRKLKRAVKPNWESPGNDSPLSPAHPAPVAVSRSQGRPSPLPQQPTFNRPDRSKINPDQEFT